MDITDFLAHNRKNEYLCGTYRATEGDAPEYFEYGIESNKTSAYAMLIKNIRTTRSSLIIRTSWNMVWEDTGFVTTQDGLMWQVTDYTTEIKNRNADVLRIMNANPSTEFIVSLIAVDNPMGVK